MIQDANKLVVFGSQFLGVIIVIVGLLTQQAQLHSPRPTGSKSQVAAPADRKGDRFARLWDDPLDDFQTFRKAENPAPAPTPTIAPTAPASTVPAKASTKALLIWNLLDARPVPEIRETRLRTRYAIVSALLAWDYLPVQESVLSPLVSESGNKLLGYFETFRAVDDIEREHTKPPFYENVTLVWSPKKISADEMNASVKQFVAAGEKNGEEVTVQILHHGSSEDLENYVATLKQDEPTGISFMRATIPMKYLRSDKKSESQSLRPITTDDVLVDALVSELSLRIPALNAPSRWLPRIVVFTESDTNYSRAIASELSKKFEKKAWLVIYSYLRGLDGRPENIAATDSATAKPSDSPPSILQARAISEASFGTSQFDYLRRLALQLEADKEQPGHKVAAVGILGSDIYDKMLVLQAVRPELPSALFFTTDLDALYLERENQPFTRNLIVASADSLDPTQSNEGCKPATGSWKLPPMRESYQTVLVKKVRELLSPLHPASANPAAYLFEIAPGTSIPLPLPDAASWKTSVAEFILEHLSDITVNIAVFCVALANAFLILRAVTTRTFSRHEDCAEAVAAPMQPWARKFVYAEAAVALLGILYLLFQVSGSSETLLFGEPLALGVSIWPSVMIRMLAFLVALVLLLTASYSFVAGGTTSKEKLEKALPLRTKLPIAHCLREESVRLCRNVVKETPLPLVEHTFEEHLEKLFDLDARRNRIMWFSVFYLLASFFLFAIWQPTVPGRGAFPLLSEKVVLSLGVSLYIIHLIFCLDLHLSAYTFLRALRSLYSKSAQDKIADEGVKIDTKLMFEATANLTSIIGKTLLYPLTVLILIILSRLRLFDNWVMTPSLTITFLAGALLLVAAALILWLEGSRLKKVVFDNYDETPATTAEAQAAVDKEKDQLSAINEGVFAAWYNQPIFAAIFSAAAVFGSLSIAGPIARMFFGYS